MRMIQQTRGTAAIVVLSASIALAGATSALAADDQSDSTDREWARVQRLASGTAVSVSLQGVPGQKRNVVSADESSVTLLKTDDSALPSVIQQTLRRVATAHPDYLSGASIGKTVLLEKRIRLDGEGVFLNGVRLASLSEILETTARADVGTITMRQRGRGVWGHLGPLGGYFVGGMTGGIASGLICRAAQGRNRCDTGAFLGGMLIGGVAGGTYGFHAARRETEVVVYRSLHRSRSRCGRAQWPLIND